HVGAPRPAPPVSPCGAPGSSKPSRLGASAPKPLSTPGCGLDEGAQQPLLDRVVVGGALGGPEHARGPALVAPDPLPQPVRRPGDRPEAVAEAVQALVVIGEPLGLELPDGLGQAAARLDPQAVPRLPGLVAVLDEAVALRQVLDQGAAEGHVEQLDPAADAEGGQA